MREAENGTDGLNKLRATKPDALILDILLPDMTGWDVLRAMQNDELLKDTPVIIMTASVDVGADYNVRYNSVHTRLTKPVGINQLLSAVRQIVS
ncbi:MAG: response regulator [Blastochloris sp.]|nr:response regulator [Blastochloris sp.]